MANSAEKINYFSNEKVAERTKLTLAEMWNHAKKGLFCDVTLIAALDGKKITAHRSVLCAANEFFKTMLCGEFKEAHEKEVSISEISGDILESFVEFCYTGTIQINEDNANLILPQALLMLFSEIVEACSEYQMTLINPTNCLSLARYAKLYNCKALLKSTQEQAKKNFVHVAGTKEFLDLSQEELQEYLSSDELIVENEKDVFQAMLRWVKHDVETRSVAISKLLPLIRLHQIKTEYLFEYVCNNYPNEHYFGLLLTGIKQNLFNAQPMPARTGFIANRIVVVTAKKIEIYNPKNNIVEVSYDISPNCGSSFKATLLEEKVILINSEGVHCFDLNTKIWSKLAYLSNFWFNNIATLNGNVYTTQNFDKKLIVRRWDSKLNEWEDVSSINNEQQNHCVAVLNTSNPGVDARIGSVKEKLYVIGGNTSSYKITYLNDVQCYDPSTNTWSTCAPMLTGRSGASAVVANGEIFVFGGKKDDFNSNVNLIEKYNPETNKWIRVSEMFCVRSKISAYLYNKKIYLLGGYNRNYKWLKLMEEFDPATNECRLIDIPNIEFDSTTYYFSYLPKNK